MAVNNKHIATFLLGLAAGAAAHKYMNMSDDDKENLANNLKNKANEFKNQAESIMDQGKEYFEELKNKGTEAAKDEMGTALEDILAGFFGKKNNNTISE